MVAISLCCVYTLFTCLKHVKCHRNFDISGTNNSRQSLLTMIVGQFGYYLYCLLMQKCRFCRIYDNVYMFIYYYYHALGA